MAKIQQDKRIRTFVVTQSVATASGSLVTSGAGLVFSVAVTTTATAAAQAYVALYDASAHGTACYDYGTTSTSTTRILTLFQATHANSAGTAINSNMGPHVFSPPIPFFDGLVTGTTNHLGTAVGATSVNIVVQLYAPRTI